MRADEREATRADRHADTLNAASSTALQRGRLKLCVWESVHEFTAFIISNTRSTLILIDTQKVW